MTTRPADWREQAACAGVAGDLFFPTNYTTPQADRAREICHACCTDPQGEMSDG